MPSSPGNRPCRFGSSCSATKIAPTPKTVNDDMEWGWRTAFDNVGRGRRARRRQRSRAGDAGPHPHGLCDGRRALDRQSLQLRLRACSRSRSARSGSPRGSTPSRPTIAAAWSTTNMTSAAGRRCSPRKREWGPLHRPCRAASRVEPARRSRGAWPGPAAAPDPASGRSTNALVTKVDWQGVYSFVLMCRR